MSTRSEFGSTISRVPTGWAGGRRVRAFAVARLVILASVVTTSVYAGASTTLTASNNDTRAVMGSDSASSIPGDTCSTLSGVTTVLDVPGTFANGATGSADGVTYTVSAPGTDTYPPTGVATVSGGQEVNFVLSPGVTVLGVVVSGGGGGGVNFNFYSSAAGLPGGSQSGNYIAPFNGGGNIPNISGIVVCLGTAAPSISLAKTASPTTYSAVGQTITYSYTITNNGAVAIASTQYMISDNHISSGTGFTCGAATALAVGATVTCSATYQITAADMTANSVTNTAVASGGGATSAPVSATVNKIAIATSLSATSVVIGSGFTDLATVSGGNSPTGTVTFNVYSGTGTTVCTGTPFATGPAVSLTSHGHVEAV